MIWFFILLVLLAITSIAVFVVGLFDHSSLIEEWKEQYAFPYIENLPETKIEIEALDYMMCQYLESDLGHGIKKGIYNPTIYLPKNKYFNQ